MIKKCIVLFLPIAFWCGCSSGTFGGDLPHEADSSRMLQLTVTDVAGVAIPNAYIVAFEYSGPKYVRFGEGLTNAVGVFRVSPTKAMDGKFTVIASGYNPQNVGFSVSEKDTKLSVRMSPKTTLSVMSYNILQGLRNNGRIKNTFVDWIKKFDPDILFLQETNSFTDASLASFAARWGHSYSVLLQPRGYPPSITSKFPITDVVRVIGSSNPTVSNPFHHGFIRAKCNGYYLYAIHFDPFHYADRRKEVDYIVNDIAQLPAGSKVLVAGDFNNENAYDMELLGQTTYLTEWQKYKGAGANPDFYVPNQMLNHGMADMFQQTNTYFKASVGVDSLYWKNPRNYYRIDYIFGSANLARKVVYADIIKDYFTDRMSDHYPNYIRLIP